MFVRLKIINISPMKIKLLFLLFLASVSSFAQYTLIPDVNFEKKLIALNIDSGTVDGKVLTTNVASLTSLNVSSSSINDLTGVQDFIALTTLNCYGNQLTALDVSKNTALTTLNCGFNKLIALNISTNLNLKIFACHWNQLTALDISKNTKLTELTFYSNRLATIDVSNNLELTILECGNNALSTLDVSKNTKLTALDCNTNKLTSLETLTNSELQTLNCIQNNITKLDVSKSKKLSSLSCFSNKIASLDLSENTLLTTLQCNYNQLATLDLSKNTVLTKLSCAANLRLQEINLKNGNNAKIKATDLDVKNNPSLYCIIVDDATYSSTNWSASKDQNAAFTHTQCIVPQYTLIPDINFEKALITRGIDGIEDGKVLTSRIADVKNLELADYYTNLNTTDLTGIQDFTSLEYLRLPNNNSGNITSLDVSKNLKLKVLICSSNKLSSLDVSKNLDLTELSCYSNKLTALDVSKNLALTKLDCSINRLTSLDVSKNLALTYLSCGGSNKEGSFIIEQSLLTSIDLSQNVALEQLYFDHTKNVTLDVSKNKNLLSISVSYNGLKTIDFSANTLLKHISCESNQLTSIDLSKYPNLESLGCGYNTITNLDFATNTNLKNLSCAQNQLTSIDLSKNLLLETVWCSYNKLTSLDLSVNPNITQVICDNNDLRKLNLKNGNNIKILDKNYSNFKNNPYLSCITVDDISYSSANWTNFKDATQGYNTDCPFSLPSNNFAVESKGETCASSNNGEINITALILYNYKVNINGQSYSFANNNLKAPSLAPGIYTVSITIPGETFEQNFTITIPKASTITAKSKLAANKMAVEITKGTAPYTVYVDGVEQFETNDSSFDVDAKKGGLLEVQTAKACEGVYTQSFEGLEGTLSAYPNPTSGTFEIQVPILRKEVAIALYSLEGNLISNNTYTAENGKVKLSLENQATGVYMAKVELDTPSYLKIIKN